MKRIILNIFLALNFLFILVLIFAYLSAYIPPDKYWLPSIFGLLYPYILSLNILFVLFWLIIKPKYLFFSLLAIIVGYNSFSRYFQLKGSTSGDVTLKVLSYNVRNFQGEWRKPSKEVADKIRDFLEEEQAEIICLQEVKLRSASVFNLPQIVEHLPQINHYQYASTGSTTGLATLTKYPVLNMQEIRFEGSQNMAIYTDMVINTDTVRVFNIHLQSYYIDPNKYDIIESPGIKNEKDLKQAKEMGGKYIRATKMRAQQARTIHSEIENSPYKVIVCGDFNDTPVSYTYHKVLGQLQDAFVQSGKGIGKTYNGKLPSYRIDYIFYSKAYKAFNFKKIYFPESDHYPISCEFKMDD